MNTSGVLDCVSVAEWTDCSSPVMVRSILLRAAAVYSARVRGLCTVIVSVCTRLCKWAHPLQWVAADVHCGRVA